MEKRMARIAVAVIGLAALACSIAAFAQDNYLVEARFYRVHATGDAPLFGETQGSGPVGIIDATAPPQVEIGALRVRVQEGLLEWAGAEDPEHPHVVLLSRPSVMVQPATSAEIVVNDEPPEYFERKSAQDPEIFVHKKLDQAPGIRFRIAVQPQGTEYLRVSVSGKVALITGREPIEGVRLPVGKPILSEEAPGDAQPRAGVSTQTAVTDVRCKPGDWLLFKGALPGAEALITMVRVTLASSEATNPPPTSSTSLAAIETKYRVCLKVLEVAPADAEGVLAGFEGELAAAPPEGLRIPPGLREDKAFSTFLAGLQERGAQVIAAPEIILKAGPESPGAPTRAAVSSSQASLAPPAIEGASYDALVTSGSDIPLAKAGSTTPGEPEFDFRGFIAGLCVRPASQATQATLTLGFRGRRAIEPAEAKAADAPGEAEEAQIVFQGMVPLGEWSVFTTTYEKSGRRVIVLAYIAQGRTPPPDAGPQIVAEAKILRIPAEHRATVMAAMVPDTTAQVSLGDVTVFRDLILIGSNGERICSVEQESAFMDFIAYYLKPDLLSAPRVTFYSKKLAAWYLRQREKQGIDPAAGTAESPSNGGEASAQNEPKGAEGTPEASPLEAFVRSNSMMRAMMADKSGKVAIIADCQSFPLPSGGQDSCGVMMGVRADPSDAPGYIDTEVALDWRWDAAPRKAFLGVLPLKHEPDIHTVQCGVRMNVPDSGWAGILFPWKEGEDGLMLILRMDLWNWMP